MPSNELFTPVPAGILPGLFARTVQSSFAEQIVVGRSADIVSYKPGERVQVASFGDAFFGGVKQVWMVRLPTEPLVLQVPVYANFNDGLGRILLQVRVQCVDAAAFARSRVRAGRRDSSMPEAYTLIQLRSEIADQIEPALDTVAHRLSLVDANHPDAQHALLRAMQGVLATFDSRSGLQIASADSEGVVVEPPEAQLVRRMRLEELRRMGRTEEEEMHDVVAAADARRRRRQMQQLVKKLDAPQLLKAPTVEEPPKRPATDWYTIGNWVKVAATAVTLIITVYVGYLQIREILSRGDEQLRYARELMGSIGGFATSVIGGQGLQNYVHRSKKASEQELENDALWPMPQRTELDRRIREQIGNHLEQIAEYAEVARRTIRQHGDFDGAAALRQIPDTARALHTKVDASKPAYLQLIDDEDGNFLRMLAVETEALQSSEDAVGLAVKLSQTEPGATNSNAAGVELQHAIHRLDAAISKRGDFHQTRY